MTTELVSLQILRTMVVANSVNKHIWHVHQKITSQQNQKQSPTVITTYIT